ncbi:hypothetical protein QJS66_15430 [Kocuria rhizophila]|nr:hypothetical protein QJS66_15430 [Kocuria rhizophila]
MGAVRGGGAAGATARGETAGASLQEHLSAYLRLVAASCAPEGHPGHGRVRDEAAAGAAGAEVSRGVAPLRVAVETQLPPRCAGWWRPPGTPPCP